MGLERVAMVKFECVGSSEGRILGLLSNTGEGDGSFDGVSVI